MNHSLVYAAHTKVSLPRLGLHVQTSHLLNDPPVSTHLSTAASNTPSRQRRKAERPQELLEAGLRLFVSKGLAATRMEDVAREAGVSKGTLYLYYPSKDELFQAVVQHYIAQVIVESDTALDQFEGSTADLIRQLAALWWQRVGCSEASGLMILIMTEAMTVPSLAQVYVNTVVKPSHAMLRRVVDRGMDRGEFRQLDPTCVVHGLVAPLQYLLLFNRCTSMCQDNPVPFEPELFLHTQVNLLLSGIAATSPNPHTSP